MRGRDSWLWTTLFAVGMARVAVAQDAGQPVFDRSLPPERAASSQSGRPADPAVMKIRELQLENLRLGNRLDGMKNGMVLNFTFENWSTSCRADRKACIKKIAAHEFGHAIGFAHEQNRTDAPELCRNERQGSDGDWYITVYDPQSIMNYCNPEWNNDGGLSALDVEAVEILYGKPPVGPATAPARAVGGGSMPERPAPADRPHHDHAAAPRRATVDAAAPSQKP